MKLFVRAFVIALVLTGAAASTQANATSASATAKISKTSAMPQPACAPSDPGDCGMGGW